MTTPFILVQPKERSKISQDGSTKLCLIFCTSFWHSFFIYQNLSSLLFLFISFTDRTVSRSVTAAIGFKSVDFSAWKKQLFCSLKQAQYNFMHSALNSTR